MRANIVGLERVELFHMETLISRRITELNDFALKYPHMRHVADEQLAIYNKMHTKTLNAINYASIV